MNTGDNRPALIEVATSLQSVSFGVEELFFSRTDARGRIVSGNNVFQRISRFDWSEMIGRPHNIVRHADMPRAVFHVLWERIRAGLPTGAYVQNRAKDGSPYWVYAIVTPIEDGYLSVRLKPTSTLFPAAEAIYREIRAIERANEQLKPAESAAMLLDKLAAAGFRSFDAFMAAAAMHETRARDAALGRATPDHMVALERLLQISDGLIAAADQVSAATTTYRYVPLNLRIQASGIGDTGASINIISRNYGILMQSIEDMLASFRDAIDVMSSAIACGAFLDCAARIQSEMADVFAEETKSGNITFAGEIQRLGHSRDIQLRDAETRLKDIHGCAQRFFAVTGEMERLTSGLAAIKVMGKVESARMPIGDFSDLISDLEAYQHAMSRGLAEIGRVNGNVRRDVEALKFG